MLTSSFFAQTHKTLIFPSKTEVRSRSVWPVGPLLGLKIASVRRPGAHETLAGLIFQAQNGLKCHSMRSRVLSDTFTPLVMPKPWNHCFSRNKTHTFRWSLGQFCTQNLMHSGQHCTFSDYRDGFFVICRQPRCSQDSSGASISGT